MNKAVVELTKFFNNLAGLVKALSIFVEETTNLFWKILILISLIGVLMIC